MSDGPQSTSYGPETSREMRSLNEELIAANRRLEEKLFKLASTNDTLVNLLSSTDIATLLVGADMRMRWFTPASAAIFDLIDTDLGRPIDDLVSRVSDEEFEADVSSALQGRTVERQVGNDRGRQFLRRAQPCHAENGRIDGVVVTYAEITRLAQTIAQLEAREAKQQLLMRELDHRVKNMLARVQVIIQLTGNSQASIQDFREALESRIESMARAHSLLSRARWLGITIGSVVADQLAPYSTMGNVRIDGPEIMLDPNAVQGLSMVVHELATNAAKFGALSVSEGRVEVSWRRLQGQGAQDGSLLLRWRELGGPPVQAPRREGYGLSVIRGLLAHELGGTVDLAFPASGLTCDLTLPAQGVQP